MARRIVRIGLWSLLGLVVLLVAGGTIFALSFDPDSLKPRIIAAVKQATGRDLTLQGHMRLGLSLQPTLTVQGASFANPPGFSRPQMATLQQLDVTLSLLPLLSHRLEISRLVLIKPDIILETDAQGRPNWQFTPEAAPATSTAGSGGGHGGTPMQISLADVQVRDGTLTWHDGRAGTSAVIGLTSLRASAPSPDANLHLAMSATYDGAPFSLTGDVGPLSGLQGTGGAAASPVQAQLEAAGAKLALDGSIAQPEHARGYRLKLTSSIPSLAALAPFAPGVRLPDLHDVSLAAQVADTGGALPDISGLVLHVGRSDLGATVAGLTLEKLDVSAARTDQPVQVAAEGTFNNAPASLNGTLGPLPALLPAPNVASPVPIDLAIQAPGSSLSVKGTAAQGQDGRPSVAVQASSDRLDLDTLAAAWPKPGTVEAVPATNTAPAPAAKPPPGGGSNPEASLPFDLLHRADADVKLNVAQLIWRGVTYRALATHIDLRGGVLHLDPFSADLPEGHVDASLTADASKPTPALGVKLRMPNLSVPSLLGAVGQPAFLSGNMHVEADLTGTGATQRAIVASLNGSAGFAMVNGTLDNRLFGSALGMFVREASVLNLVGQGGINQVQCLVARFGVTKGIATLSPLLLTSTLLTMEGSGTINLGAETLDLRLQPQTRIVGGTGIVLPLRVSGSFRSPSVASDPAATVTRNAGTVAGALLGTANPLGAIASALGAQQLLGGNTSGCGAAPRAPASPLPLPVPVPLPKLPNVGGALRQLFR